MIKSPRNLDVKCLVQSTNLPTSAFCVHGFTCGVNNGLKMFSTLKELTCVCRQWLPAGCLQQKPLRHLSRIEKWKEVENGLWSIADS